MEYERLPKPQRVVVATNGSLAWWEASVMSSEIRRQVHNFIVAGEADRRRILPKLVCLLSAKDPHDLAILMAQRAVEEHDALLLEGALDVSAAVGTPVPASCLTASIGASWHGMTEEVIRVLSATCGQDSISTLMELARNPPDVLDEEVEGVTASNNALHGLKRIDTPETWEAIRLSCSDPRDYVAKTARRILAGRAL